jgi:hypothetical protein
VGVEVQDDQGSMNSVLEREHTARRQDEARFEKGVKNIDTFKRRFPAIELDKHIMESEQREDDRQNDEGVFG